MGTITIEGNGNHFTREGNGNHFTTGKWKPSNKQNNNGMGIILQKRKCEIFTHIGEMGIIFTIPCRRKWEPFYNRGKWEPFYNNLQ